MAVSVPVFAVPYFTDQSNLFPDDDSAGSMGMYTTFGEEDSNTSFGSWPDHYSCSEVSSFPSTDSFSSLLNSLALPSEDDLNLAAGASAREVLEQFGCGHPNTPVLVHSHFVDTPGELYIGGGQDEYDHTVDFAAENHYAAPADVDANVNVQPFPGQFSEDDDPPSHGRLEPHGGRVRGFHDDESAVMEEEPPDGVHIPPPLNKKRIEMYDDAYYESIEAAEVPVDVIENKRPFQCGLAGCHKTFKNAQTMKMHHKTHFSDGSAGVESLLPTLTSSVVPGSPSAAASWMAGRTKKIPSRCPKCRKTFVGLYELRRHYGRKHSEGERPFQCRKCDKRFYIEVDVRDHEKLCGEQIECKCGLKFAFKCNMIAHRKAHPECQGAVTNPTSVNITNTTDFTSVNITNAMSSTDFASVNIANAVSGNSTSVNIRNADSTSVTIMASPAGEDDSSRSRWIRPQRAPGPKRCHELVEESRPDLMTAKRTKVYSRRSSAPALNFMGPDPQQDATCAAGLGFPDPLWSPYPSLPWSMPDLGTLRGSVQGPVQGPVQATSVFGDVDQFPRPGKLGALDLLHLAGVTPGLSAILG